MPILRRRIPEGRFALEVHLLRRHASRLRFSGLTRDQALGVGQREPSRTTYKLVDQDRHPQTDLTVMGADRYLLPPNKGP